MTRHDREHELRSRMAELRRSAVRSAASLAAGFDAIVEATSDVATDDEHDPEGHTNAWERQQLAALRHEARLTIAGIDAAVERLDEGRYGICAVCEGAISPQRLEALPATSTCIDCATRA